QRRRLLRRTSAHNPVPVFIGEHREVLHRLHISPTGQRFSCAWDVDVPPGALSAALEALTIACQLLRVFDCGRAPCKGDGGNQPNHISSAACVVSNPCPVSRSQSSFPVERANEPRLILLGLAAWSCAGTGNVGQSLELGPAICSRFTDG